MNVGISLKQILRNKDGHCGPLVSHCQMISEESVLGWKEYFEEQTKKMKERGQMKDSY